jgi:DNA replication protein DnaC
MVNLTQLTTPLENEFIKFVPNCQHSGKVGFCEICHEERINQIDKMKEHDLDNELRRDTEDYYIPSEEEKLRQCKIPKKFYSKTLDNFEGSKAIKDLCISYVDGFVRKVKVSPMFNIKEDKGLYAYPGSLLLSGKTGCGKTHLAIAIVKELLNRKVVNRDSTLFITAPELLLEIRDTFNKNSKAKSQSDDGWSYQVQTENDVLDKYSQCELLLLDDLGAEKVSDFTIQSLYLVIDRRNREERPTIVTTNLSLEEIESLIDARMASRLSDMKVVKLTMPDYRKKR